MLIIDRAPSHVSDISLNLFSELDISYVLIPPGLTPILQPLDIGVNKIFKDKLKYKFEQYKIDKQNINEKLSLQDARIRLLKFINEIWYNDQEITPSSIINCFDKSGITKINYITKSKEKVIKNYILDLLMYEYNYVKNNEINVNVNNISFDNLSCDNYLLDVFEDEYRMDNVD